MKAYEEALSIYRAALGGDNYVDVAVTLNNVGQIYRHLGKYDKAMDAYQRALAVMKASLGDSHRNVAATLHNIALLKTTQGEYDEALVLYKEVLTVQRSALGDEHPDVAVTLSNMAEVFEYHGDIGERGKCLRSTGRKSSVLSSPSSSYRRGKYRKATRLYKKALRVRRASLGPDHYFVALTCQKLGTFHLKKERDYSEALRRFTEALEIYRKNGMGDNEPQVSETLHYMRQVKIERMRQVPRQSSGTLAASPMSTYSFSNLSLSKRSTKRGNGSQTSGSLYGGSESSDEDNLR